MTTAEMLKTIRARNKKTPFAFGIMTADKYVQTLADCVGPDICNRIAAKGRSSYDDLLRKASHTLVYGNEDMVVEEKSVSGLELPKNTLMAFRHVLTSSTKDRDGDTLHSDGASVDPKMLLLWQHVHTLPIGKLLVVEDKNAKRLLVTSCIVDMNALCHDAAVMVDNDMGRFSHGFRALEFTENKARTDGINSGFDVTKFEIMEESLVSVPANVDAQTEEVILSLVEGGKLTSPLLKRVGRGIRERRSVRVSIGRVKYRERLGDFSKTLECDSVTDLQTAVKAGLLGAQENENKSGNGELTGEGSEEPKDSSSTSKEADEHTNENGEEKNANNKEVKSAARGSWQEIMEELKRQIIPYLQSNNISIDDDGWSYVHTMFDNYAIVCVYGKDNVDAYYRIDWQMVDGKPKFAGTPQKVEVVDIVQVVSDKDVGWSSAKPYPNEHTARINDPDKYDKLRRQNNKFGEGVHVIFGVLEDGKTEVQSIRFDRNSFTAEEAKKWLEDNDYEPTKFEESSGKAKRTLSEKGVTAQFTLWVDDEGKVTTDSGKEVGVVDQKAGRVLSSANANHIKEAMTCHKEVFDLGSEHASRSCRALVKEANGHLEVVVSSLGDEKPMETSTQVTAKDAMAIFLATSNVGLRKRMQDALTALDKQENNQLLTNQFKALIM